LVKAVLGDDPDVDVDAPRSRRLGIALEVHLLEHLRTTSATLRMSEKGMSG